MNNHEIQPRHSQFNHSQIDEELLPESLKGRLKLTIINEKPPGSGTHGVPVPESYQRLTVLCGENKDIEVNIDYLNYLSTTTFDRDGCIWYLVHTWTKTWGENSKSSSVFINLNTGEHHMTPTLSMWRGYLSISKDGKLVIIDAGITASSSRQINVIDISDLNNIQLIHYEEEGYFNGIDAQFGGEDGNCVLLTYFYTKKQFKYYYLNDKSIDLSNEYHYNESTKKVLLTLKKNSNATYEGKQFIKDGKFIDGDNGNLQETKYGSSINTDVSKMIVVSETIEDIDE